MVACKVDCGLIMWLEFFHRITHKNGNRHHICAIGCIHEHEIKQVVVGLIPLKLHPKLFWKKGNLSKIKRNNNFKLFMS